MLKCIFVHIINMPYVLITKFIFDVYFIYVKFEKSAFNKKNQSKDIDLIFWTVFFF